MNFREALVVICRVEDLTRFRVNQPLRSAVCRTVIHVALAVGVLREKSFAVLERVASDHDAQGFPRVEIPLGKRFPGRIVKFLGLGLGAVIGWQFFEFAEIGCDGISGRVDAGFENRTHQGFGQNLGIV